MGHRDPTAHAVMRGVKAEGGWAVVCTEEVEIHPDSDVGGFVEGRLWDDADIPAHERLVGAVHAHGALAGIELVHSGMSAANLYGRIPPLGPAHLPVAGYEPIQARRMSADDLATLRRRHRQAVARSLRAGYDVVYVYAAHGLTTLQHFLSRRTNDRSDGYGGSLANRARLLREVLEDTLEECDGRAAVACRIVVDELLGGEGIERGEIDELFGLVGELPDLWDLMVGVLARRLGHLPLRTGGVDGGVVPRAQAADVEAGRRRRVAHLARHDGPARPRRRPRPDRRGAALDRRSVPAAQDRGGAPRRHPRVHRLQHLRHRRLDGDADPLHAEPVDGRGVAARLAPGALPAQGIRGEGARRRRRACRARGGDGSRTARVRRRAGRGDARAGRARAAGGTPPRPRRLDPRRRLPHGAARRSCRTSTRRARAP